MKTAYSCPIPLLSKYSNPYNSPAKEEGENIAFQNKIANFAEITKHNETVSPTDIYDILVILLLQQ